MITEEAKHLFLDVAKNSIYYHLKKAPLPNQFIEKLTRYPITNQKNGIFITLKINNQLRGCIGCVTSNEPLFKTLPYFAIQSAFYDPRFEPLSLKEFKKITIKIAILTAPIMIEDYNEIKIGKHGVIFNHQQFQSVFLPEVPNEQGWSLEATLKNLERKANAPTGSWESAKYQVFESFSF